MVSVSIQQLENDKIIFDTDFCQEFHYWDEVDNSPKEIDPQSCLRKKQKFRIPTPGPQDSCCGGC